MSYGEGYGVSFGGTGLVPVTSPVSAVGAPLPMSFEFADEGNNPLPGMWEFLVLSDDGAGNKTSSVEPSPGQLFRVTDGVAGWFFERVPGLPAPNAPFDEHGVLASPLGILQGRNAEFAAVFVAPTRLLDRRATSFVFELLLGLRANDACTSFVGGRARAEWAAGVWTTPLAVEAVSAADQVPGVLDAGIVPDVADPTDIWRTSPTHELRLRLRGDTLTVILDGYIAAVATVPSAAGSRPLVLVRAYNVTDAGILPVPCLLGLSLRSLREKTLLGPPPQIIGELHLENPPLPRMYLPLNDLVAKGLFKRTGARTFVAQQDVVADMDTTAAGNAWAFSAGDGVRALEAIEGQELVPVIADLALIRAERRGEGNG